MDNPHFHIKAFETIMALKKIDQKLFPSMFALSLDHIPQKWFFKQEPASIATWDDVKRLFIARYRANVEEDSNYRELDIIKKRKNEGFTEFYNRWRSAAAKMVNPPDDPKCIKIIIDNL